MGLEMVELILECEEQFGVKIPDAEASKVECVIDLYALICRCTRDQPAISGELSAESVADLLRPYCVANARIDRTTRLSEVLPARRRRAAWSRLSEAVGRRLPPLRGPHWVGLGGLVLCIAIVAGAVVVQSLAAALLGLLIVGSATAALGAGIPQFPPSCSIVEDIVEYAPRADGEAGWRRLVAVVADQFGVTEEQITPTTRFIEDLRAG